MDWYDYLWSRYHAAIAAKQFQRALTIARVIQQLHEMSAMYMGTK
jgi:hypothetical protein